MYIAITCESQPPLSLDRQLKCLPALHALAHLRITPPALALNHQRITPPDLACQSIPCTALQVPIVCPLPLDPLHMLCMIIAVSDFAIDLYLTFIKKIIAKYSNIY